MCMSTCESVCLWVSAQECVCVYVCVCVCVAACQAVPSGCLTELFSLTGRLIAVAAPRLCQTSPWGHRRNRRSACLCTHAHTHAHTQGRVCLSIKCCTGNPKSLSSTLKRLTATCSALALACEEGSAGGPVFVCACKCMPGYMHVYICLMNYVLLL